MTSADHALVAADPDVPGLAALLDPTPAVQRLAAHWDVREARITYLRYKPHTSLVAALVLRTADGATHHAQGMALGTGSPDKLGKLLEAGRRPGTGLGAVADLDAGLAVADVRADRALPGVVREWRRPVRTLVYKPGRRWVAHSADTIVKVHRPGAVDAAARGHAHLLAHRLPVPELLAVRRRRGVVRSRYVPGTPLDVQGGCDRWAEAGELLAALQAAPPGDRLPTVRRGDLLTAAVAAVRAVAPGAAALAQQTTDLALLALGDRHERTVVHGDFSTDQVLATPGGLVVVDLDRVALDDPLSDVASWVAAEIAAGRAAAHEDPLGLAGPLVTGYTDAGRPLEERALLALTAAEVLRRAAEPFRRHLPDWPDRVQELVQVAHGHARAAARAGRGPIRAGTRHGSAGRPARPATLVETFEHLPVSRAWPRGTEHALLQLTDEGGGTVAAQWFAEPARAAEVARRVPGGTRWRGSVVVHPHGADARLPALTDVLARPGAQLVAHRPGRRAVVRVPGASGTEYVKVVRPAKASDLAERGRTVATLLRGSGVVVPELLGPVSDGVLRWSDVGGSTLYDLARDWQAAEARTVWQRAGEAVRALHSAPREGVPARHGAAEELAAVDAWLEPVRAHGLLDPEALARARTRVARALATGRPGPVGVLHRDLHDKQLLLRPDGRIGLIDVDTLAVGERALDVANVLVHLELRRHQGVLTPAQARAAREGFLAGLGSAYDRVPAYTSAARLRLAGVYAFRPRWRSVARSLLART